MVKKICLIIHFFIFNLLHFAKLLTNKNFYYVLKDVMNEKSIESIIIKKKKTFFIVNSLTTKNRLDAFFTKEPDTIKWIDEFKENSIFYDIGANVGNYSIYAAIAVKKIKQIFSFEPSFLNTRILSRNISLNNLTNKISIIQLPLFDKRLKLERMIETGFFEGESFNSFSSNVNSKGLIKSRHNNIPLNKYIILGTSLDFLIDLRIIQQPDYIKIDVDGIENLILRGGTKILSNKRLKSILVELYKKGDHFKESMQIIKKYGFKLTSKLRDNHIFKR